MERGGERVYEIGWAVIPAFQRRGFASEATRQAVQRARSARGLRYVHAFPDVANAASNAVCRAVGFELLGAIDNQYPPGTPRRCNDWRLDLQAPRRRPDVHRTRGEETAAELSTDRILTTHTGSLPRPAALRAADNGDHDEAARDAVTEVVALQVAAGIDAATDGEMSKPSYATYSVKDSGRQASRGEKSSGPRAGQTSPVSSFTKRGGRESGRDRDQSGLRAPGPIIYRRSLCGAPRCGEPSLRGGLAGVKVEEAFISAASPGVVSFFLESHNYYHDHEALHPGAIADADEN